MSPHCSNPLTTEGQWVISVFIVEEILFSPTELKSWILLNPGGRNPAQEASACPIVVVEMHWGIWFSILFCRSQYRAPCGSSVKLDWTMLPWPLTSTSVLLLGESLGTDAGSLLTGKMGWGQFHSHSASEMQYSTAKNVAWQWLL